MASYNPSNLFARARLVKTYHVTEYSPAKTGEYLRLVNSQPRLLHFQLSDWLKNSDYKVK